MKFNILYFSSAQKRAEELQENLPSNFKIIFTSRIEDNIAHMFDAIIWDEKSAITLDDLKKKGIISVLSFDLKNDQKNQVNVIKLPHFRKEKSFTLILENEILKQKLNQLDSYFDLNNLFNQDLVGIAVIKNKKIVLANNKFLQIFSLNSLEKINVFDLFDSSKKTSLNTIFEACLKGKKKNAHFKISGSSNHSKSFFEVNISSTQYDSKPAILLVVFDISKRINALRREEKYKLELLHESKMAAIGRLTAGIAHNLNTPISVIQGNAELLNIKYPESEELILILRQTERMRKLIQQMVDKGKKEFSHSKVEINLNKLILELLEFFKGNLYYKNHIQTYLELDDDLPLVLAVYSDFYQALRNIIQNSIDALYKKEKRELSIKTKFKNDAIFVFISDTGDGINEDQRELIFEPFFTTKPGEFSETDDEKEPKGNGLGLTMTYFIFKKYDVEIMFDSTPAEGTCCTVKIPKELLLP